MKFVVDNILVPADASDIANVRKAVCEKLGCRLRGLRVEIQERSWVRSSSGGAIKYKVIAETNEFIRQTTSFATPEEPKTRFYVKPQKYRPVVVGFGIKGMVAAYFLAKQGLKPFVIEKGDSLKSRTKDSIVFGGEGGISTLTGLLLSLDTLHPDLRKLLEEDGIIFEGTEKYRFLNPLQVKNLIGKLHSAILELGGETHFRCTYVGESTFFGKMTGIFYEEDGKKKKIKTNKVLFANGDQDDVFYLGFAITSPKTSFNQCVYGKRYPQPNLPPYLVESTSRFGKDIECSLITGLTGASLIDIGSRARRCCHTIQFANKENNVLSYLGVKIKKEEASKLLTDAYDSGKPFQIPSSLLVDFLDGKAPLRLGTVKPQNIAQIRLTDLNKLYGESFSSVLKLGVSKYSKAFPYLTARDSICGGLILLRGNENSDPVYKNGFYYARIAAEKCFDFGALATSGFATALKLCQD